MLAIGWLLALAGVLTIWLEGSPFEWTEHLSCLWVQRSPWPQPAVLAAWGHVTRFPSLARGRPGMGGIETIAVATVFKPLQRS